MPNPTACGVICRATSISFSKILILSAGLILGWSAHRMATSTERPLTDLQPIDPGARLKEGPWGELYATPFNLTAPDEILPLSTMEEQGTIWFFAGKNRAQMKGFLDEISVPPDLAATLTSETCLFEVADGCEMHPGADDVFALPSKPRMHLYREIAKQPKNRSQYTFIHRDFIAVRLGNSGLSDETLKMFESLCCTHGDYQVLAGLPALLSRLSEYSEKLALMRALSRQKTLTLRMVLRPGTDVSELANYWGKGMWASDVRTILSSIAETPKGGSLDILSLLPPLPSSRLYLYPTPDNPMNGPTPNRDCHWTALNFFNDSPDPKFGIASEVLQEIKTSYYPVTGDARFGDVIMLSKPNGDVLHSAVFIAEEVVFTKNGASVATPWMLSTIPDLLKQYSFEIEPEETLKVNVFRKKSA